jgi:hypothetical protein
VSEPTKLGLYGSRLTQSSTPAQPGDTVWTFTLTEADALAWERERLDMLEDAFWLVREALAGNVEGPLTLRRTRLPIRVQKRCVCDEQPHYPRVTRWDCPEHGAIERRP